MLTRGFPLTSGAFAPAAETFRSLGAFSFTPPARNAALRPLFQKSLLVGCKNNHIRRAGAARGRTHFRMEVFLLLPGHGQLAASGVRSAEHLRKEILVIVPMKDESGLIIAPLYTAGGGKVEGLIGFFAS